MKHQSRYWIGTLFVAAVFTGCTTTHKLAGNGEEGAPAGPTAKVEEFLMQGDYTSALIECIDLSKEQPNLPGLPDLQKRILRKLEEQRAATAAQRAALSHQRMTTDLEKHKDVPDTYGLRRLVKVDQKGIRTPNSAMQKALQKKVTLHLENADISRLILTIGTTEKINMVADPSISSNAITIHADQVPLSEILNYVARNIGVAFYLGENTIWVTPGEQGKAGVPMEMRCYRLRKGIAHDIDASDMDQGGGGGGAAGSRSSAPSRARRNAPSSPSASSKNPKDEGEINIVDAINRFVPQPEGSDLLFDTKAHTLIVKNTVENLVQVEDLIEALDVCPPQVLIEARFMSTAITDLRELGIDWVLNSVQAVSKSNGKIQTQIDKGGSISGDAAINAAQGMNLVYRGVLTDPLFQATLHALEKTGKTKTLSIPRVTTVNNRPATIRVGEDFRYFEEYNVQSIPNEVSGTTGASTYSSVLVPVGTPTLEELGIQLKVVPSVGADMSSIDLRLVPEISAFERYEYFVTSAGTTGSNGQGVDNGTNGLSTIKLPIFSRSKIDTEVIVQSGETVVMGGLIKSTEDRQRSGVPILMHLPLIGYLFTHDNVNQDQQNLLIFVTATLISQRGEELIPLAPPRTPAAPAATAAPAAPTAPVPPPVAPPKTP